jgi:uncharacterized membrane protein
MVSLGSGILALINGLSINLAALVVLWYQGYRPEQWFKLDEARAETLKRIGTLAVAIALLSVFLGAVTYDSFENAATEDDIRSDVADTVAAEADATLLETDVQYGDSVLLREPARVVVTVGVPPGANASSLATRIDDRVDRTAGHDIDTQVRYVTTEAAG